jgi:hypothetical protein
MQTTIVKILPECTFLLNSVGIVRRDFSFLLLESSKIPSRTALMRFTHRVIFAFKLLSKRILNMRIH